MTSDDLAPLVDSWVIHLRAERKSDGTIQTYLNGVRPYLTWCQAEDVDPMLRNSLQRWVTTLLDAGRSASTAKTRMQAVRHFARWLAEEGEIESNPFDKMRPPKVDQPVIPVLTEQQVKALLKACRPAKGEETGLPALRHRRDEAMIRLMAESGLRASECLNIEIDDLDLIEGRVTIRRGKGGKGRTVPFGPQTAKAIDRYMRVRRLHRLADGARLWLGDRGKGLSYHGLYWALGQRAEAAGIEGFHPHQLRHTSVDRWLSAGGSETGAMAMHGWSSPDMLQRYGKANREARAIEEARRLNLGDL